MSRWYRRQNLIFSIDYFKSSSHFDLFTLSWNSISKLLFFKMKVLQLLHSLFSSRIIRTRRSTRSCSCGVCNIIIQTVWSTNPMKKTQRSISEFIIGAPVAKVGLFMRARELIGIHGDAGRRGCFTAPTLEVIVHSECFSSTLMTRCVFPLYPQAEIT